MPDDGEAAAVAALLEELAASSPDRGLGAAALRAAVLLRHEAGTADRDGRPVRPERGGPEDRRGAGRVRDDAADERDCRAGRRDDSADERDGQGRYRRERADAADRDAKSGEQRVLDALRGAELRDQAAAERARTALPADDDAWRRHWQAEADRAEADRAANADDRELIRQVLLQLGADRESAARGRHADAADRRAGWRDRRSAVADRHSAAYDRQAAEADRDQAVIEGEEEAFPRTGPGTYPAR